MKRNDYPETITVRLPPELHAKLRKAVTARRPYPLSITTVTIRGIELALNELKDKRRSPKSVS